MKLMNSYVDIFMCFKEKSYMASDLQIYQMSRTLYPSSVYYRYLYDTDTADNESLLSRWYREQTAESLYYISTV